VHLSIVVCAYAMNRELPRTIHTLSRSYQRDIRDLDYEIIVVDNGSPDPVDEAQLQAIASNLRVIRTFPAEQSPARTINTAMRLTSSGMLGLLIDGARMVSPGLIRDACDAYRIDKTRIIGSLSFHLGPDVQMRSIAAGYSQAVEDDLLAATPWKEDGYSLFGVSVLAGSSNEGWFGCIAESNAVFLDRTLWNRLGGLDERFRSPGGGCVNLDFWERAVSASGYRPCMLLGEGTFHQVHGGAATGGTANDRKSSFKEYKSIHGKDFSKTRYQPLLIGSLSAELAQKFIGEPKSSPRRVHSIRGRSFKVGVPPPLLDSIQAATLKNRYKGVRLAKNPFDLALYLRVLEKLKPKTIMEIGTSEGGSALWLRDQCRALGFGTKVISIDRIPPALDVEEISFLEGDSTCPRETFPHAQLAGSPHPWLVIEDSAHTYESVHAVLDYFDQNLLSGDYIVVEDGVVADLRGQAYLRYADGPNMAVADFLLDKGARYRIDSDTCDYFGSNVTYCPNAWLVRQ